MLHLRILLCTAGYFGASLDSDDFHVVIMIGSIHQLLILSRKWDDMEEIESASNYQIFIWLTSIIFLCIKGIQLHN